MAKPQSVHDRIATLSSELGGTVGVAARNLASQASVCIHADGLFPMASCFKSIVAELYEHLGEPA